MNVVYGAGKNFQRLVKNGQICEIDFLIDSHPEKYPEGVLGYKVYSNDILSNLSKDDCVIVASRTYYGEIYKIIREINDKVDIVNVDEAIWLEKKKTIKNIITKADKYTIIDQKQAVNEWLHEALTDEVGFWRGYISSCAERDEERLKSRTFVYPWNEELRFIKGDVIIDVGSGPLPKFGNMIGKDMINYIPTDPLSYQYKEILDNYEISLPIASEFSIMEMLTFFYKENSADYVIVHNALDHSMDILRAFIECLRVTKVSGYFLMYHLDAEGLFEDYIGMHKWNITEYENDLIFFDCGNSKINVSKLFDSICDIEVKRVSEGYRDSIVVKIWKKADVSKELIDLYDTKEYIGDVIKALFERLIIKE